jgi:hypothetical protein
VSKFVGKFRREEEYEDEYFHIKKKKTKNEHSKNREFKKMRFEDDYYTLPVSLPKKFKNL